MAGTRTAMLLRTRAARSGPAVAPAGLAAAPARMVAYSAFVLSFGFALAVVLGFIP